MEINLVGLAAALATFFGVWLGHVSVRKIERETVNLWKPALIAFALGTGLEVAALLTPSLILSAMGSIVGVTLLWDALEFFRQQKRIKQGHASDFSNFMTAVIDEKAFKRVSGAIDRAHADKTIEVAAGGKYDRSEGWFIRPTVLVGTDPTSEFFTEEYFGPV